MGWGMAHDAFPSEFRVIYDHAVALYARGKRGAETYFDAAQKTWLDANGVSAQAIYDYAEDQVGGGVPSFEQALGIETVRRDYFLTVQHGRASGVVADAAAWPAKDAAINGIGWLPRILPKARAKLRGELPVSMMYCCGGDRKFFATNGIAPVEFLRLVREHEHDDAAIIAWVTARAKK